MDQGVQKRVWWIMHIHMYGNEFETHRNQEYSQTWQESFNDIYTITIVIKQITSLIPT